MGGMRTYNLQLSQWEAIQSAAEQLGHEGGGTMWLHSKWCQDPELTEHCECTPMPIEIPALT